MGHGITKAELVQGNEENQQEVAIVGGGCFWCVEAVYKEMKGIHSLVSGYCGGFVKNPGYKEICTGRTGHAEVLKISYDPLLVSYQQILEVFWVVHDPTTLNRQGNDIGTQYRSAIYYLDDAQKELAEKSKAAAETSDLWSDPIVTEITELDIFYPAEDYHQDYFGKNPSDGYCLFVAKPKVEKFKAYFAALVKA